MPVIEGVIERLTFHNEENGYTVASFKTSDGRSSCTVVGTIMPVSVGESLRLSGDWENHASYGRQFKFQSFERLAPATLTGIEKYLGSGLIKGIGPQMASRIVAQFGLETLNIIRNHPERLLAVEGIGTKKHEAICAALAAHREIEDIMVFLQGYGVTPAYAAKIYKTYGRKSIQVVSDNPYRLAEDVFGIGFKTADKIALAMGIPLESPKRLIPGIEFFITEMTNEGHIYAPLDEFVAWAADKLTVDQETVRGTLPALIQKKSIICEGNPDLGSLLYPAQFYYAERTVAERLIRLLQAKKPPGKEVTAAFQRVQEQNGIKLAPAQMQAVQSALKNGVLVITGGPGTGKTTTLKTLLEVFRSAGLRTLLAAPTGRAAKRMNEATGQQAKTLHRLLEFGFEAGGFRFCRNETNPLDTDVVIIDEVSMVDLMMMHHLLKAIPDHCRLVLVGDADQLPSVGAGNVLRDIIDSGRIPVVRLTRVFRQGNESYIAVNAHLVKDGRMPVVTKEAKDFYLITETEPEKVTALILDLVSRRLPAFLKCDPINDIQVLAPMRRFETGVDNLNVQLQKVLNKPGRSPAAVYRGTSFRAGDKVMQIRNNYQKMVFNGDIGRIVAVDQEEQEVRVAYPEPEGDRIVPYDLSELDEIVLSYAVSVHKSQGSEYPVVVMPVTTQHYIMLQRNLLYTAITRAKKMVVLVGTKKALFMAIKNNRIEDRRSLLALRIRQA
jgi:exodeoxyribonuclease V alpha subunit